MFYNDFYTTLLIYVHWEVHKPVITSEKQLTFTECLLYAKYYSMYTAYIDLLNPHAPIGRYNYYSHLTYEETKAQKS